jgi:hypothetical protein
MRSKRIDEVFFSQRPRAEMIFERFSRDRALHGLSIDSRGKR